MKHSTTSVNSRTTAATGSRRSAGALVVLISSMLMMVGLGSPASAHDNTIVGTVTCRTDGGWAVAWQVTNSEADKSETFIESNRTSAVPVGTVLGQGATATYTEAITTKPTGDVTLTLKGEWTNGTIVEKSGTIPNASFSDACSPTKVQEPAVPVVDECGPGNAAYGDVPAGPWTVVRNADGSLVITANAGSVFSNGQSSITFPVPTDTNVACATPPVTPPVTPVTPPVTTTTPTMPEVLPAVAVRAKVKKIDKCGRSGDLYKPTARPGIRYWVNGAKVPAGTWLRATSAVVRIKATTVDPGVKLIGKQSWKLRFRTAQCAKTPVVSPQTGA